MYSTSMETGKIKIAADSIRGVVEIFHISNLLKTFDLPQVLISKRYRSMIKSYIRYCESLLQ